MDQKTKFLVGYRFLIESAVILETQDAFLYHQPTPRFLYRRVALSACGLICKRRVVPVDYTIFLTII